MLENPPKGSQSFFFWGCGWPHFTGWHISLPLQLHSKPGKGLIFAILNATSKWLLGHHAISCWEAVWVMCTGASETGHPFKHGNFMGNPMWLTSGTLGVYSVYQNFGRIHAVFWDIPAPQYSLVLGGQKVNTIKNSFQPKVLEAKHYFHPLSTNFHQFPVDQAASGWSWSISSPNCTTCSVPSRGDSCVAPQMPRWDRVPPGSRREPSGSRRRTGGVTRDLRYVAMLKTPPLDDFPIKILLKLPHFPVCKCSPGLVTLGLSVWGAAIFYSHLSLTMA